MKASSVLNWRTRCAWQAHPTGDALKMLSLKEKKRELQNLQFFIYRYISRGDLLDRRVFRYRVLQLRMGWCLGGE
jgi:hypothetical protein